MAFEIIALGGFGEIGRNCVAVDIDGKIFILDMGFHLERYLRVTEDDFNLKRHGLRRLISSGALPDLRLLRRRKRDVAGILCSHAHLDHIGAIPFLASKFSCPVFATPFTANVIRSLLEDADAQLDVVDKPSSSRFSISGIDVEFIPVSHSTPQTVAIALHTSEGSLVYANDYKEDLHPPFGKPTDIARFKELSGQTRALILDSLYAPYDDVSSGELQARTDVLSLKDDLLDRRAIVFSTFSSHIHRMESLCDLADALGREVVFMGRSLHRYMAASKEAGLLDLFSRGRVLKYRRQIDSFLKRIVDPSDYVFITTGHQGEPGAVLSRMADGLFEFSSRDCVVFSCKVIPVPTSIENRDRLERKLSSCGVSLISDVHVSGHAYSKDHERLLSLLDPDILIPSHAEPDMVVAMERVASRVGISGKRFRPLTTGDRLRL